MTDKQAILEEALEAMLADNEKITARAVVRRTCGMFKHPTDITRHDRRKALVAAYIVRQQAIRSAIDRSSKSSRSNLERLVAIKNAEIDRLCSERELLIASHRAMIRSVAEMGGFRIWKRFFEHYQATIDALDGMNALPRADIIRRSTVE